MKRLTGERGDICIDCDESRYCRTNCDRRKQYDKLSHYENLEKQLEEVYGECPDLLETAIQVLVKHVGFDLGKQLKSKLITDESVDQWENWTKADKEGRLLELPCKTNDENYEIKIGDILWRMSGVSKNDKITWQAVPMAVEEILERAYRLSQGRMASKNSIGKSFFLSRAECLEHYFRNHTSLEEDLVFPVPDHVTELPRTDFEDVRIYKSYTAEKILHIFVETKQIKESELL